MPMSNRIDTTFSRLAADNKTAFVSYVCACDPDLASSLEIIKTIADSGADIIELGVPFSDPLADGIVNQLAADRALKGGANLKQVLELIRSFRQTHETPIVLFSYLNPIFQYGFSKFLSEAEQAGTDGLLLLDLPPDEAERNAEFLEKSGLKHITLIAPNTPASRLKALAEKSEGFIYALSRTGVTGAQAAPADNIGKVVANIKAHTDTPVCVGFGIGTPEQADLVAKLSDGVVVGSAVVNQIADNLSSSDLPAVVREFITPLIDATHGAK